MATAVGLNMKITADTAGIGRGINRTERMLGNLQKSTNSATRALQTLAGIEIGRLIVSGISSIATSLSNATRSAVRYAGGLAQAIDETAKLAQRTGIAVESLQALQVAASLAGVGNIEGALQKVTIAIGNAAESGNTDAFDRLGLDFAQLERLSPEEQFRRIAAAIQALPTEAERASAAVKLFGRSGVELLPLFAQNLEEIEARAKRLGIVLSESQTGAIEQMNDSLSLVRQTFDGIIGQVTANLAPVITELAEKFLSFVEGFESLDGGMGGTGLADAITNAFFDGADYVASILDPWVDTLIDWANGYSSTTSTLASVFEYFSVAVDLLQGVFYSARAIFNGFIIGFAEVIGQTLGRFSKSIREGVQAFQDDLANKVTEDFNRAGNAFSGNRSAAQAGGRQLLGGAVRSGREMHNRRNDPEEIARRDADRRRRDADRIAAQDALRLQRDADRRQKIEEARLKKVEELNERYAEKALEIETNRLEQLSKLNQNALQVNDLRSGGVSEVLRLATGREDPAIEQRREQLNQLKRIQAEISKLGVAVEI